MHGGHPESEPLLRETPEETRALAHRLLCSHLPADSLQGPAQGLVTAGTVPMGAAPMVTQSLSGRNGRAALRCPVSRAGESLWAWGVGVGFLSRAAPLQREDEWVWSKSKLQCDCSTQVPSLGSLTQRAAPGPGLSRLSWSEPVAGVLELRLEQAGPTG